MKHKSMRILLAASIVMMSLACAEGRGGKGRNNGFF